VRSFQTYVDSLCFRMGRQVVMQWWEASHLLEQNGKLALGHLHSDCKKMIVPVYVPIFDTGEQFGKFNRTGSHWKSYTAASSKPVLLEIDGTFTKNSTSARGELDSQSQHPTVLKTFSPGAYKYFTRSISCGKT
jgi:hypothetical protein